MRSVPALIAIFGLFPFALPAFAQQAQPGLWTMSNKITSISGPRVPPQMAKTLMSEPATTDQECVTPAEAAQGFQKMLQGKQGCQLSKTSFGGGTIDVTRVCQEDGRSVTTHLHGPYSPTAFTLNAESTGGPIQMTMIFSAKRIGACK